MWALPPAILISHTSRPLLLSHLAVAEFILPLGLQNTLVEQFDEHIVVAGKGNPQFHLWLTRNQVVQGETGIEPTRRGRRGDGVDQSRMSDV